MASFTWWQQTLVHCLDALTFFRLMILPGLRSSKSLKRKGEQKWTHVCWTSVIIQGALGYELETCFSWPVAFMWLASTCEHFYHVGPVRCRVVALSVWMRDPGPQDSRGGTRTVRNLDHLERWQSSEEAQRLTCGGGRWSLCRQCLCLQPCIEGSVEEAQSKSVTQAGLGEAEPLAAVHVGHGQAKAVFPRAEHVWSSIGKAGSSTPKQPQLTRGEERVPTEWKTQSHLERGLSSQTWAIALPGRVVGTCRAWVEICKYSSRECISKSDFKCYLESFV